jgi:3-hydroxyisobutyrate dehydrogenase-like beta-hydroxyacid dehydrogenase
MFDDKSLPSDAEIVTRVADRPTVSAEGKAERARPKIGFIGLGLMGSAMAKNLTVAGHSVTAYVRRPEQMDDLKARGLKVTLHKQDLFDCNIVISMLPDDNAVREVFFGNGNVTDALANHMAPGSIHLSMSTISTVAAANFASEHQRRGQGYVAAPVFGNPDAAKARQLAIVVAGPAGDNERCRTLVKALGQVFVVGADPAQANRIKLLGNMMTATSLEVLGEVTTVLRKCGQDPQQFVDIMTGTMFGSRVHKIYGSRIVAGTMHPAWRCRLP